MKYEILYECVLFRSSDVVFNPAAPLHCSHTEVMKWKRNIITILNNNNDDDVMWGASLF